MSGRGGPYSKISFIGQTVRTVLLIPIAGIKLEKQSPKKQTTPLLSKLNARLSGCYATARVSGVRVCQYWPAGSITGAALELQACV